MKCKQITDTVYLGDQEAAQKHPNVGMFDEIVTLGYRNGKPTHSTTGDRYIFVDGEHEYSDFEQAVDFVVECLRRQKTILVHCASGVSRSSGVVSAALAEYESLGLEEAFQLVKDNTEHVDPLTPIRESMEEYTGDELDDFRSEMSGW